MDLAVIGGKAAKFRKTTKRGKPIKVTVEGRYFRIHDGRHRFFAAVIAGRTHIEARVVKR